MTSFRFYVDKYGVVWEKLRDGHVWNRFTGLGLWDSGKGLEPYVGGHTEYWTKRLAKMS